MQKNQWRAYFSFSKYERLVLVLLSVLILTVYFIRFQLIHFTPNGIAEQRNLEEQGQILDSLSMLRQHLSHLKENPKDIRTIDELDAAALGIDKDAFAALKKALQQETFEFKALENLDLKDRQIYQLKSHFTFHQKKKQASRGFLAKTANKPKSSAKLELNAADSASLRKLKGIGPAYAARIVKYRELLGGYVAVEQLLEVYGMQEEYYQMFADKLTIDQSKVKQLSLMENSFKTLVRHPYLSYEQVQAIFNARKKRTSEQEMVKWLQDEMEAIDFIKIKPYLKH